jgi:hypothetical protein
MSELIQIMRTGQLYKLDMADAVLKEAQLPHFTREESVSGMREAMPVAPSMAPGVWWAILVPEECAEDARHILSELPFEITTNPDVWDSQPDGASGRFGVWYRVFAVLMLGYILYSIIMSIISTL